MRRVAREHLFCVNYYIFHIDFILHIFFQNTYLIFEFICLTVSLADTHGIAKYARTYIRTYTHTHTHTHTRGKQQRGKREKGDGGEEKDKKEGDGFRGVEERGY